MNIAIIGVPYSLDALRVGMGAAPEALLAAGLAERARAAGWEVAQTTLIEIPASDASREERIGSLLGQLADAVRRARANGRFPLVVGGDCLTALGTLAGLLTPESTAVAWLDAHGDFNTPQTTLSGYLGGMPLACATGRGLEALRLASGLEALLPEAHVALIGVRDLDPPEAEALAGSSVMLVRSVELEGGLRALNAGLAALGELDQLYLHVDVDVLDPAEAPGVDFPAPGGLSLEGLRVIVQRIAGMGNLAALGITAVNPEKDIDGRTVQAALDIVETALTEAAHAVL